MKRSNNFPLVAEIESTWSMSKGIDTEKVRLRAQRLNLNLYVVLDWSHVRKQNLTGDTFRRANSHNKAIKTQEMDKTGRNKSSKKP